MAVSSVIAPLVIPASGQQPNATGETASSEREVGFCHGLRSLSTHQPVEVEPREHGSLVGVFVASFVEDAYRAVGKDNDTGVGTRARIEQSRHGPGLPFVEACAHGHLLAFGAGGDWRRG